MIGEAMVILQQQRRERSHRWRGVKEAVYPYSAGKNRPPVRDAPLFEFLADDAGRFLDQQSREALFLDARVRMFRPLDEIHTLLQPSEKILPEEKQHPDLLISACKHLPVELILLLTRSRK